MFDFVRRIIILAIFLLTIGENLFLVISENDENFKFDRLSIRQNLFRFRRSNETRRFLRMIYFRGFDGSIDEDRIGNDVLNLTSSYQIDLQVKIIDQTKLLSGMKICEILDQEIRDTIIVADFYTKEIDLISRSLKIPTVAITNRYSLVQGKERNPFLFKFMDDAVEQVKSFVLILEKLSVYTRIALIYDMSTDMVEYQFSYPRSHKQQIIYRALFPRSTSPINLQKIVRKIIDDLSSVEVDLILCVMTTENELKFINLINNSSKKAIAERLLNRTSWWFASRLGELGSIRNLPKIYTAYEDRRRLLTQFSFLSMRTLFNAIVRTYIRLPAGSSMVLGAKTCHKNPSDHELQRTQTFIDLFANFTEWSCDVRSGSGVDPILFEPKTLIWRHPTLFYVHTEYTCQGMITRLFHPTNLNADQIFRSCRTSSLTGRKGSSPNPQETSNSTNSGNALIDLNNHHRVVGILSGTEKKCQYVHLQPTVQTLIVVGVVEPPYIFISDTQIASDFHCNYGIPCYQIDPNSVNFTTDMFLFRTERMSPAHCCYGISINLLLRMEDSNLVSALKTLKLFVFTDKTNKWLALQGALSNHRAHLSISPIPSESFLARSIDLSPPFYHSSYVVLMAPKPTGPSLGAFLQPFSWATWCLIFVVLNMTALFETFFEWNSPYGLTPRGRRRKQVFSLASAVTLGWSVIFSHTFKTKSPKCWSNRFLGNVWGGFGIIFIAIYTAKLAAFMVEIGSIHTANTIHEISDFCRKMQRCTVGVVANSSDEEYLKRFHSETLYRYIHYVPSYGQGIDLLRGYSITYLLMDHSMARYYLTRDVFKLIRISDDHFGTFGLSLGFAKFENELRENTTNVLLSYVEKGIIQRLHDDWYVYENCEIKQLNENRVLTVDRLLGVFILLIAGMLVGFVVLMCEWLIFKYAVPYWRRRGWTGWMFCSQRLYAVLNVPEDVFQRTYNISTTDASRSVGERLHNHSTRRESLDLRVINVPKLLCTTYQLKEEINKINEQREQNSPLLVGNGIFSNSTSKHELSVEKQILRSRINELEQELEILRSKLTNSSVF